jgi:hypothetical protein
VPPHSRAHLCSSVTPTRTSRCAVSPTHRGNKNSPRSVDPRSPPSLLACAPGRSLVQFRNSAPRGRVQIDTLAPILTCATRPYLMSRSQNHVVQKSVASLALCMLHWSEQHEVARGYTVASPLHSTSSVTRSEAPRARRTRKVPWDDRADGTTGAARNGP